VPAPPGLKAAHPRLGPILVSGGSLSDISLACLHIEPALNLLKACFVYPNGDKSQPASVPEAAKAQWTYET
jgi:hypothetical protein